VTADPTNASATGRRAPDSPYARIAAVARTHDGPDARIAAVAGTHDGPDARIAAVARALPAGCVIGGWAAARLHERAVPGSDGLVLFGGGTGLARVLVCAPARARLRPREGVQILRSEVPEQERTRLEGVPVTAATRTAFDLARLWPLASAVVAVDRLLHCGGVEHGRVEAMALDRHRWRGRPSALRVLSLADGAAASPRESVLRMLWLGAGMPRPQCHAAVLDPGLRPVAEVDLLDPVCGVVGQVDDAGTAGTRWHDHDSRWRALEALGLVVVRATTTDLAQGQAWQHRLRRAYRSQRLRPGRERRWVVPSP
jgi:hypothetical protein